MILNSMGIAAGRVYYITGEVDYRKYRHDQPYCTNLCLRYPIVFPYYYGDKIFVDYDTEYSTIYLKVSDEIYGKCYNPSGIDLRNNDKTKIVLLKAEKDPLWGTWVNVQLCKSEIVPITKNYSML